MQASSTMEQWASAASSAASSQVSLPPHTVRIKRKRGQDPLKALVFKLAGTFEHAPGGDDLVLTERLMDVDDVAISPVQEQHQRVFQLPKKRRTGAQIDEGPEVDESLREMVQSYLENDSSQGDRADVHDSALDNDHEVEDYVYDIYYREKSDNVPLTASSSVGVIMIESDDEFLINDDDDDDSNAARTDDEDSNAEDFYRNDYPESASEDSLFGGNSSDSSLGVRFSRMRLRQGDHWLDNPDLLEGSDADVGPEDGADEEWSEDESLEQYRDRIMKRLESDIAEGKS